MTIYLYDLYQYHAQIVYFSICTPSTHTPLTPTPYTHLTCTPLTYPHMYPAPSFAQLTQGWWLVEVKPEVDASGRPIFSLTGNHQGMGPRPQAPGIGQKGTTTCSHTSVRRWGGGWSHSHDIGLLVSTLHVQMQSCRDVVNVIFNTPRASGTPTLVTIITGPGARGTHTMKCQHHSSDQLCDHLGWRWEDCWLASQC